jgi:hypothetical protein
MARGVRFFSRGLLSSSFLLEQERQCRNGTNVRGAGLV